MPQILGCTAVSEPIPVRWAIVRLKMEGDALTNSQ
jgi:hypothetical protein